MLGVAKLLGSGVEPVEVDGLGLHALAALLILLGLVPAAFALVREFLVLVLVLVLGLGYHFLFALRFLGELAVATGDTLLSSQSCSASGFSELTSAVEDVAWRCASFRSSAGGNTFSGALCRLAPLELNGLRSPDEGHERDFHCT